MNVINYKTKQIKGKKKTKVNKTFFNESKFQTLMQK
jgi:hypothetical protein